MKKILVIAAAAIVALTACSKTDATYVGENEQISFRSINSVFTKANEQVTPFTGTLGVYAHNTADKGAVEFENTEFTLQGKVWRANPPRYWNGKELRFTIYSPYSTDVTVKDQDVQYTNVPENLDFLYGFTTPTGQSGKTVDIRLKHSKSIVRFKVQSDILNLFQIVSIKLDNAATTGDLHVTYANSEGVPAWSNLNSGAQTVFDGTVNGNFDVPQTAGICGKEMLIIPQGAKGTATITYKENAKLITKQIKLQGQSTDTNWLVGKRYTYNIKFVNNEILFNATVDPWEDAEENETFKDI